MFDVSIIIPVYNVEMYIRTCLQSVIDQQAKHTIECIVVDDCGNDKSMDIVDDVIADYSGPIQFKVVRRKENGGLSAARNSGIEVAQGEYLYFLDSDDSISKDCIDRLYRHVVAHPGVDMVFGISQGTPDTTVFAEYFDFKSKGASTYSDDYKEIKRVYLNFAEVAWNKLINAAWLRSNSMYFREKVIHEDVDWHLRSYGFVKSYACELDGMPTYLYLQRGGSITSGQPKSRSVESTHIIFAALAKNTTEWTPQILEKFTDELFKYKGLMTDGETGAKARSFYKDLFSLITSNSNLPYSYKILMTYFKLPLPLVSGSIVKQALKLLR